MYLCTLIPTASPPFVRFCHAKPQIQAWHDVTCWSETEVERDFSLLAVTVNPRDLISSLVTASALAVRALQYFPWSPTDLSEQLYTANIATMASQDEEATLSIPSLAFVAFLSFFIIRYFMSSRSPSAGDQTPRRNGQRFTPAQVEQIVQMFPQLSRRDIMWDLQRNGGSVAATTERILAGRGLDPVRRRPMWV